jgi:hypothetical protein
MKNLLSENMMRFGTKNLSEAAQTELVVKSIMETIKQHGLTNVIREKLAEQVDTAKATGTAQKIVGMLMVALGSVNSDEQKVLNALKLIKAGGGKVCYDAIIKIIRTSPKVKSQFGRNFNLVSTLIKVGGIGEHGRDDTQSADVHNPLSGLGLGITDEEWTKQYKAILMVYNTEEQDF